MRGAAWMLADVLPRGCGGVATLPASAPDEDVARLVAMGVCVVLSPWVRLAEWRAGEAA